MTPPPWWKKNTANKIRHSGISYQQVFLGELYRNLHRNLTTILNVKQLSPDKFEITLFEPYHEGWLSFLKYDSPTRFKKIVVDREKKQTEVYRYTNNNRWPVPYVTEFDLFYNEPGFDKGTLTQVRHNYWLNIMTRIMSKYQFLYQSYKSRRLYRQYEEVHPLL